MFNLPYLTHFRHCDFNCGAGTLGPERVLLDRVMCIGYFRLLTAGRLTATCQSTFANHLPFRTSSPLHSFPAAPLFCRYPSVQVTMHLSEQIPVVNAFSLPRFRLSGTNSLFLSFYLCQFFQIFLKSISLFKKAFSSVPLP